MKKEIFIGAEVCRYGLTGGPVEDVAGVLVVDVLEQHDDEPRERVSRVEHRLGVVVSAIREPRPPLAGGLDFGYNLKRVE